MGSSVIAECKCGYNLSILIGGGMMNFTTTCYFPCLCKKCEEVVQVNLLSRRPKCPSCRTTRLIPYDDSRVIGKMGINDIAEWNMQEGLGKDLVITDGKYYCPKCKKNNLRFLDSGLCWD